MKTLNENFKVQDLVIVKFAGTKKEGNICHYIKEDRKRLFQKTLER